MTQTIDWGMVATALAPMITIVVTWLLARKTAKDNAAASKALHASDVTQIIEASKAHAEEVVTALAPTDKAP